MKLKYAIVAACLFSLSACATLFGDKADQITINSNTPDARIIVNSHEIGRGSATYSVPAGQTATITATKPGCTPVTMPTGSTIRGATFLDLLFLPAVIVDLVTGAYHKTDPAYYNVTPNCYKG